MTYVRICAVLIGLRSLSNIAKPFGGEDTVLVFFGQVLRGDDAALPALGVAAFMLLTAINMWQPTRLGLPLITAYAAFVLLNMALWLATSSEELQRVGAMIAPDASAAAQLRYASVGMVFYAIVAVATTAVPAWILYRRPPS